MIDPRDARWKDMLQEGITRQTLARMWIGLACVALLVSGALAMVITSAKMPWIQRHIQDIELVRWCLVTHVNLATLVWFSALPAGLIHLAWGEGHESSDELVPAGQVWFYCVAAMGILLMLLALPRPGVEPVMANYLPVVLDPQYLLGLGLYILGAGANFVSPGLRLPRASAAPGAGAGVRTPGLAECRFGIWAGSSYFVLALLALVIATTTSRELASLPNKAFFEILMWGAGHLLQHFSVVFLAAGWVILLSKLVGKVVLPRERLIILFAWLAAPALVAPVLILGFTPAANAYREGFTLLMRWGIFPPVLLLIGMLWRHGALRGAVRDYAGAATVWSMWLLVLGFAFGSLIRGPDMRVPGHYHASIGAVTVGFMALAYHLLARAAREAAPSRWISRAVWTYGIGQSLFASGMFVAGIYGMSRKTYGSEHVFTNIGQYVGMGTMAIGGLIAFAGGFFFGFAIVPLLRKSLSRASGARASSQESSALALAYGKNVNRPPRGVGTIGRSTMMKPMFFVLGAVLGTITMTLAADKGGAVKLGPSTPEKIAKGKASYQTNCLTCHGPNHDGKGPAGQYLKPAPRNLVSDPFKQGDKPELIFATISKGLAGTGMAAFGYLKDDEREALAYYVASLRKK